MSTQIGPILAPDEVGESLGEQIKMVDSPFTRSTVTVIANQNHAEIDFKGCNLGPFEINKEYKVKYWIAKELVESGIAFIKEGELLDLKTLEEEHYTMKIQTSKSFARLEPRFYPKARRLLAELKKKTASTPGSLSSFIKREPKDEDEEQIPDDPGRRKRKKRKPPKLIQKVKALKYAENLILDIIRNRHRKILYRIQDRTMTEEILEKLTPEEKLFYEAYKDNPEHVNNWTDEYLKIMTEMISAPIETD